MYNEYDGNTYYPKYSEDLVHTEVMLPENAPKEYENASVLWNSVEMIEKSSDAQLARTYKVELPNEWSYELATEVMRDYVKRNFVDLGMCAQFAIHDSENEKIGQRNLHCHILLTVYDLLNCPRTDPLDCPYIALYTVLINRKGKVPEHPPRKIVLRNHGLTPCTLYQFILG